MAAPRKKEDEIAKIIDAVEQLDLTEFQAWGDLDVLSSRTHIDAIQVDPEAITIHGGSFRGLAPVYVVLEYGDKRDRFTTSDSFLGRFKGHFDPAGAPVIDEFTVDTSPFYAGAE